MAMVIQIDAVGSTAAILVAATTHIQLLQLPSSGWEVLGAWSACTFSGLRFPLDLETGTTERPQLRDGGIGKHLKSPN